MCSIRGFVSGFKGIRDSERRRSTASSSRLGFGPMSIFMVETCGNSKLRAGGRLISCSCSMGAQVNVTGGNLGTLSSGLDCLTATFVPFEIKQFLCDPCLELYHESDGEIYQFRRKIVRRLAYYSQRSSTGCAGLLPRTIRESIALAPNQRFQFIVEV